MENSSGKTSSGGFVRRKLEFAQYLLIRIFQGLLFLMPWSVAQEIGARLGTFLSWFLRDRRELVLRNLKTSFPEKSDRQIQSLAKSSWQNLGRTAFEFAKIPCLSQKHWKRLVDAEGLEHVDTALAQGKGLLYLCAHYGNWEVLAATHKLSGRQATIVARPLSNPYVDRWVRQIRLNHEGNVITHHQVLKEGIRCLKKNGSLAILADHNLYEGGVFVEFFGRPAATTTILALLSLRLGCPIIAGRNVRVGKKLKAFFEPAIWPVPTGDRQKDIQELTQKLTKIIEGWIREHPEQWFWVHNRWKRQPDFDRSFVFEENADRRNVHAD